MPDHQRLSIRGIGAVTPLGANWAETWKGLLAGNLHVCSPEQVALPVPAAAPACAVPALDRGLDDEGRGPAARLLVAAASQITELPSGSRILVATNHGDADSFLSNVLFGAPTGRRMQDASFAGTECTWLSSACTGGLHLLWLAWLESTREQGAWMVAAADSLSAIGIAGFYAAGATGQGLPQPLRSGSGGMLVSEGAVAMALSSNNDDRSPAILGVGVSCDAGHPTHPDPSGKWLEAAITDALTTASCLPDEIAAVVAHGTGTRGNDTVESAVLARVFQRTRPVVTSLKGTVGHVMSAAGLLNVATAREMWRTGLVPPCAGGGEPLAALDLAVPGRTIAPRSKILTLASGFGGNNVAAVIG